MEPTTSVIEAKLRDGLTAAYPALYQEYLLFLTAMATACVVVPLFTVWILNRWDHKRMERGERIKAYTHRESVIAQHFLLSATLPLLMIRKLWIFLGNKADYRLIGATVLLLVLAAWAAHRLWKWRVSGMFATSGAILGYAALEQYLFLRSAAEIYRTQDKQAFIERYAWYIQMDYSTTRAMSTCALALIVLVFLAVYCYKRRFLFLPGRLCGPRCANCGQLSDGDGTFCTHCGHQLSQRLPVVRLTVASMDRKFFCMTCGTFLVKSACPACGKNTSWTDVMKKAGREVRSETAGKLRYAALSAVVLVVFAIIPNSLSPMSHLMRGSGAVYTAFIRQLNELCDDPEKASDAEWLVSFDSAAKALYTVDARWCYVEPRSVPYKELIVLPEYAEAAFLRMGVVERISETVHAGMEGSVLVSLRNDLKATVQLETAALGRQLYSAGWLEKVERIGLDSARVILQKVRADGLSAAVLFLCGLMCVWMLNSISSSWGTGSHRLEFQLQNARDRADNRSQRYAVWSDVLPKTAIGRAAAVGRGFLSCLIRTGNELWLLVLHLAGTVVLLLSVFRWRNFRGLIRWMRDGLADGPHACPAPSAAYQRSKRADMLWAVTITLAIIAAAACYNGYSSSGNKMDETTYLFTAKAAVCDYSELITAAIQNMQAGSPLTEEYREWLYELLRTQVEADRSILDMSPDTLEELEDWEELHAGICSLCEDDLAALERIMAALEVGQVPSPELLDHYIKLRGENYLWVMQQLLETFAVYDIESAAS